MKTIRIKGYDGKYQDVQVSDEFFAEWRKLENETQRVYRREMYHRSGIPLEDIEITIKVSYNNVPESRLVADEERERLYAAIDSLTDAQRRRVLLFLEEDLPLREIARREGRDISAVTESFNGALRKLRRILEKQ